MRPLPSGVILIFELEPDVVCRLSTVPESVNAPPVAENVGVAEPPIVRLPLESSARTTLFVPAPPAVIG